METATKINLLNFDRAGLEAFFASIGEKPYRARQVLKWMYHAGVVDFDDMTDLSKALRAKLKEVAEVRPPEVALDKTSEDGTRKWLLKMDCGNSVETVFIPEDGRGTICVSSQVGCTLNCQFCSTARQGFNRNLSVSEIIGQIYIAQNAFGNPHMGERVVTNVVLMGMGEPLMNYDNVLAATRLMTDDLVYGISKRRVTLSTAGVVPALEKLAAETDISLAVSLHAPNDALRDQLVPLNKKYRIRELLKACRTFLDAQPAGRRITWEYVMLDGINDKPEHAHQLVKLLRGIPSKVNLIPFNPFPGAPYKRSKQHAVEIFRDILYRNGLMTITRKTRGDDIDAACGQLVGNFNDRTRRSEMFARSDAAARRDQSEGRV